MSSWQGNSYGPRGAWRFLYRIRRATGEGASGEYGNHIPKARRDSVVTQHSRSPTGANCSVAVPAAPDIRISSTTTGTAVLINGRMFR